MSATAGPRAGDDGLLGWPGELHPLCKGITPHHKVQVLQCVRRSAFVSQQWGSNYCACKR